MRALARLTDAIDRIVITVGRAATWFALALVGVTIFDVITRRFLVLGSTKLQELEWHFHTALFILCVGFAYVMNAHVRIDLFRDRFTPRVKSWIEFAGCLLFAIPYIGLLCYLSFDSAYGSYLVGEISSAGTGLPYRWIVRACMTVGYLLLLLACISVLIRHVILLFGPPDLARQVRSVMEARAGFSAETPTAKVEGSRP
jgi:TRAP-type mannitol/chloroaromatic compound transport system permease small subunit